MKKLMILILLGIGLMSFAPSAEAHGYSAYYYNDGYYSRNCWRPSYSTYYRSYYSDYYGGYYSYRPAPRYYTTRVYYGC